jgi:TPR repeat protein
MLYRLLVMLRPRLRRRFDCGPVLHAHEKTPPPEKVIVADIPQCGRHSALTGFKPLPGCIHNYTIKHMQLLGNLRWPLLVALAGLLLTTEVQGKAEGHEVKAILQKAEAGDVQSQTWLGIMHYEGAGVSKNLDEAAKWIKRAAESGSIEAQYMLSKMYGNGEGLPKSEADESKWLLKAAESGHPKAQYEYGRRIGFYFGKRDPGRDAESVKWIRKSADQGYAPALVALATCFYLGDGVAESNEEAEKFYRKAADQDYKEAKIALGKMFMRNEAKSGDFVEYAIFVRMAREDEPKVLEIDDEGEIWVTGFDGIRKKCESDETGTVHVPGKVQLKDTYLETEGYKQNDKTKRCVTLNAEGFNKLRFNESKLKLNPQHYYYQWYLVGSDAVTRTLHPYDEPHGYTMERPRISGPPYYKAMIDEHDFPLNIIAQFRIAGSLRLAAYRATGDRNPPCIRVPEIEFRWNRRAAEYGHPEAQHQLAGHYAKGLGVEKNLSLAAKWYLKSAEQGNVDAQWNVGYCYLLGRGLPRDEIEGYAYLNMASATDESLRKDVIELESEMSVSAKYAGQQRTRQLIKEVEDKKESLLKQSKESQKAREKKGA